LQAAIEFTDVNDSVIVNKIIEDSVKVHIQKISDVQAKISQCMGASSNMRDADQNIDAAIRSLVEATNPAIARKMAAEKD
jgi:ferritin